MTILKRAAIRVLLSAGALMPGAAPAQTACGLFEAVEPGDTFEKISKRCGVPMETLLAANPGVDSAAPQVATAIALALPESSEVSGEPPSPGPLVGQVPEPEPVAQVVIVAPEAEAPTADGDLDVILLQPIFGQWVPENGLCADPEIVWTLEPESLQVGEDLCVVENTVLTGDAFVLETSCGGNGVMVARDFVLRPVDALTMSFSTGAQDGVLKRCVPE